VYNNKRILYLHSLQNWFQESLLFSVSVFIYLRVYYLYFYKIIDIVAKKECKRVIVCHCLWNLWFTLTNQCLSPFDIFWTYTHNLVAVTWIKTIGLSFADLCLCKTLRRQCHLMGESNTATTEFMPCLCVYCSSHYNVLLSKKISHNYSW